MGEGRGTFVGRGLAVRLSHPGCFRYGLEDGLVRIFEGGGAVDVAGGATAGRDCVRRLMERVCHY